MKKVTEVRSDFIDTEEGRNNTLIDVWFEGGEDEGGEDEGGICVGYVNRDTEEVVWLHEEYKEDKIILEEIATVLSDLRLEKEESDNSIVGKEIDRYISFPTDVREESLQVVLFLLKKMEYLNKKKYHAQKYIEKIELAGIKIDKGFNPFSK